MRLLFDQNLSLVWKFIEPHLAGKELARFAVESDGFFSRTFPNHNYTPTELAQGALMEFIARCVPFEFRYPEGAPVRGRGTVPAAAMPMPETAVAIWMPEGAQGRD